MKVVSDGPRTPGLLAWAVIVAILALLIGASVGIMTDAPYNDDFAYLTTVRWLHEDGVLKFTNWQYMTLVTQTALGGLWTLAFGYSVHALRVLTLLVWAGGVLVLIRACGPGNWVKTCLLVAAAALNPMALVLATSFMTDIYYWALIILALTLFASGLESERRAVLAGSWIALFFAVFVRQLAMPVAVAFVAADLLKNGFNRSVLLRSVLPLALIVLAYILSVKLAAATIGLPGDFGDSTASVTGMLRDLMMLKLGALRPFFSACVLTLAYVGLFFLPLFLAGLVGMIDLRHARLVALGTVVLGVALFLCIALLHRPLPSGGNLINLFGIGPRSDWRDLTVSVPPIWWAVTALACLSGAFLVVAILTVLGSTLLRGGWTALRGQWRPLLFITGGLLGNAPLMIGYAAWFDRHQFVLLALLGIGCFSLLRFTNVSPLRTAMPLATAALGVVLSLLLLHDFGAWQRATMEGHAKLVKDYGVAPSQIDGGFEMSNYVLHAAARSDQPAPVVLQADIRSRPCQVTDLASSRADWTIAGEIAIARWLPIGPVAVYYHCRAPIGRPTTG